MVYKEEIRDLFSVSEDYYLVHCISADFMMGRGIVVEFNKRFDMQNKLLARYGRRYLQNHYTGGDCILEGRVLNLITKPQYWSKPTYGSMRRALKEMKATCIKNNITKVAMPLIGCGLDKLEWGRVSEIIQEVFNDTDIEILVCSIIALDSFEGE